MAESTYSRILDASGRIMIPIRLRDQLGLVVGREYTFEIRQINGRNYICIDCGMNTELEEAMKLVQNAGLKVVQNDDWQATLSVVYLNHQKKEGCVMYEFEVLLTNGERTFIWGYSFDDAKRRHPETAKEIVSILFREYID